VYDCSPLGSARPFAVKGNSLISQCSRLQVGLLMGDKTSYASTTERLRFRQKLPMLSAGLRPAAIVASLVACEVV
jgi:hypothetical protein